MNPMPIWAVVSLVILIPFTTYNFYKYLSVKYPVKKSPISATEDKDSDNDANYNQGDKPEVIGNDSNKNNKNSATKS
jgi:hypothetical protein